MSKANRASNRKRLLDRYVQLNVSRTDLAQTSDTSVQRDKGIEVNLRTEAMSPEANLRQPNLKKTLDTWSSRQR